MTPEQLGTLAASLKAALAIIEAEPKKDEPDITYIGREGDPIRVRFERRGESVHGRVLHTDESLRNTGKFFTSRDDFSLSSSEYPALFADTLFVWGRQRADDDRTMLCHGPTPHDAAEHVVQACAAVVAFNAQWRAEKAKPTLEQDIEMVRGIVKMFDTASAAFERIVARVK